MRSNTAEFSVLLADIRQSQHCRKDERTNKLTAEQAEFSAYAEKHGFENLCRVLFNVSEFVFVD